MATIIPGFNIGSMAGEGFSQGVSSGLKQLAERKLKRMNEEHEYEGNLKILKAAGINNPEAYAGSKELTAFAVKRKTEEPEREAAGKSLMNLYSNLGLGYQPEEQQHGIAREWQSGPAKWRVHSLWTGGLRTHHDRHDQHNFR